LTLDQLRNASYQGIYDTPVRLIDGKYEGPPFQPGGTSRPEVILVDKLVARGDLDGDGSDEAVVLLNENSAGSGRQDYLAVVAARDGKPINVATQLLGDRVQLRSMKIEDGRLIVDAVAHGPAEPLCCPTQKVRRIFTLAGSRLSEIRREELGTIAVTDLQGVTWVLEQINFGEPVKPEAAITLRIDKDQITGSAGCNSYFTAYSSDGPGQLTVGPTGATRKACAPGIMEQETRYLNALQAVTSYGFLAGDLALTYRYNGSFGTLLLAPRLP
jgi:heat shock protein HslJ